MWALTVGGDCGLFRDPLEDSCARIKVYDPRTSQELCLKLNQQEQPHLYPCKPYDSWAKATLPQLLGHDPATGILRVNASPLSPDKANTSCKPS